MIAARLRPTSRLRHLGGWWLVPVLVVAGLVLVALGTAHATPHGVLPNRVIATVPVGARPYGVTVNPRSHKVYVSNNGSSTVSVIDAGTNAVVATVPVGREPYYWLGVLPDLDRIYVVNNGGGAVDGSLSVIDGLTDAVVATIGGLGLTPVGIAAHPTLNRVYVEGAGRMFEVDGATNTVLRAVDMPGQSRGLVVDPVLGRGYSVYGALLPTARHAWVLPGIQQLAYDPTGGGYPALDPVNHRVFLADPALRRVQVVDLATLATVAQIPLSFEPFIAAYDPVRGCLYTTNPGYIDMITVVDVVGRRELGTIRVGMQPTGIAVDPDTGRVYVANTGQDTVTVIQGERCERVATATITPAPATATPTARATPTAQLTPSATPARACICQSTRRRVPLVVLDDAMANPARYLGWLQPLDPGKPVSPANPRRTCLALQNFGLDYHPLWNRPIWRVGCP